MITAAAELQPAPAAAPKTPRPSRPAVPVPQCLCELFGQCALHALRLNTEADE